MLGVLDLAVVVQNRNMLCARDDVSEEEDVWACMSTHVEIAEVFVVVQSIANDELVWNLKPRVCRARTECQCLMCNTSVCMCLGAYNRGGTHCCEACA